MCEIIYNDIKCAHAASTVLQDPGGRSEGAHPPLKHPQDPPTGHGRFCDRAGSIPFKTKGCPPGMSRACAI